MSLSDIIAKLKSMEGTEDIVSELEAEKTDLLGKINQRNEEAKENRLKFESMEATMKSILDKIGTKDAQDAVNKIDGSTAELQKLKSDLEALTGTVKQREEEAERYKREKLERERNDIIRKHLAENGVNQKYLDDAVFSLTAQQKFEQDSSSEWITADGKRLNEIVKGYAEARSEIRINPAPAGAGAQASGGKPIEKKYSELTKPIERVEYLKQKLNLGG
jgi:hypothetical protein